MTRNILDMQFPSTVPVSLDEAERAVIRGALRQWARDRFTLDDELLAACDALQIRVGNASVYASPAPQPKGDRKMKHTGTSFCNDGLHDECYEEDAAQNPSSACDEIRATPDLSDVLSEIDHAVKDNSLPLSEDFDPEHAREYLIEGNRICDEVARIVDAAQNSHDVATEMKPNVGLSEPWCEYCASYHPKPRDVTHKQSLRCFAPSSESPWIPVSDCLPTHVYSVLLWVVAGLPAMTNESPEIGIYNADRAKWQVGGYGDDDIDVEVTYWRPIEPPTATPKAERSGRQCTECPYFFTEAEIAAEDKNAWGHPCHGVKDQPNATCESFREAQRTESAIAVNPSDGVASSLQHDPDSERRGCDCTLCPGCDCPCHSEPESVGVAGVADTKVDSFSYKLVSGISRLVGITANATWNDGDLLVKKSDYDSLRTERDTLLAEVARDRKSFLVLRDRDREHRRLLREWQRQAERIGKTLGCSSVDIEEKITTLRDERDRLIKTLEGRAALEFEHLEEVGRENDELRTRVEELTFKDTVKLDAVSPANDYEVEAYRQAVAGGNMANFSVATVASLLNRIAELSAANKSALSNESSQATHESKTSTLAPDSETAR